ncbi:MAG: CmcJ/NvfI family oxidoreductase [Actinomycetota bacterium]
MTVYCETTINYVGPEGIAAVGTAILDGRAVATSWQTEGFELRMLPTAVADWRNGGHVAHVHEPELAELARVETGCDEVVFYPAIVRDPEAAAADGDLGPIEVAHSDYTERYRAMLGAEGHPYLDILAPSMRRAGVTVADLAAARRIVTLQVWRNIGPRSPDRPLAFCDATTIGRGELVPHVVERYAGVPTDFESFLLMPPTDARRRWFSFPAMTADEVVLFRAYDSDAVDAGRPFWTPHCAFVDTVVGGDAPARASVEMRAICVFRD